MNEGEITKLLRERHKEDVFVSQCKTGRSSGSKYRILDGLALKRSWENQLVIGYEIKVSKQDFRNDNKWQAYLEYCHEFYFVSPYKLILPEELPPEAGLVWVAQTGNRLFMKKKAVRRQITIPVDLLYYIIICRAAIDHKPDHRTFTRDAAKAWLEDKAEDALIGRLLGHKIQERTERLVAETMAENKRLNLQNSNLQCVKALADELKIDYSDHIVQWRYANKLKELKAKVPAELLQKMQQLQIDLQALVKELDEKQEPLHAQEDL